MDLNSHKVFIFTKKIYTAKTDALQIRPHSPSVLVLTVILSSPPHCIFLSDSFTFFQEISGALVLSGFLQSRKTLHLQPFESHLDST